jgi:hypothetical protein
VRCFRVRYTPALETCLVCGLALAVESFGVTAIDDTIAKRIKINQNT